MKVKELREFTDEELKQKIDDSMEELFNLRFQKGLNRLENPLRIKIVRKDIAKIKTLLTEREKSGTQN
ncbi:MAG: 50S ribosomal protein L29 [Candidatus Cloacimonetes bacterium]|jgi:large subunit ribosomal protein L29|nr:50S ribosomal protein L29 [Candidatus Cloacimonadota bacterium]